MIEPYLVNVVPHIEPPHLTRNPLHAYLTRSREQVYRKTPNSVGKFRFSKLRLTRLEVYIICFANV